MPVMSVMRYEDNRNKRHQNLFQWRLSLRRKSIIRNLMALIILYIIDGCYGAPVDQGSPNSLYIKATWAGVKERGLEARRGFRRGLVRSNLRR